LKSLYSNLLRPHTASFTLLCRRAKV